MYYVVFTLCALCDARSLSVPRVLLLVLCLVACVGAGAVAGRVPVGGVGSASVGDVRARGVGGGAVDAGARPPTAAAPAAYPEHPVHHALSGLLLALPVYRLAVRNRCGVGDCAGAYALGGRYGVAVGAFAVTAGLVFLLGAAQMQSGGPRRAWRGGVVVRQRPALSPARYPLFPALLAGDLTVRATTRLLTAGGVL